MNICFLSETAAWGGGEVHTLGLAETLAERGHEVVIAALGHGVFDEVGSHPGVRFKVLRVPLPKPVKQLRWGECTALVRGLPSGVGVLVRWGMQVGSLRLDLAARAHFRRYLAIEHSAAVLPPPASRRYCFGLLPGHRTVSDKAMTLQGLEAALAVIDGVGAPDYGDEGMLQYLRAERIIPPYQTRGYKLVEMVRIYEVGTPRRS